MKALDMNTISCQNLNFHLIMNYYIFESEAEGKKTKLNSDLVSAYCMKDNTLLLNSKQDFFLGEMSEEGKFTKKSEIAIDKDKIVTFKYDAITGQIYFTTEKMTIKCISKDIQSSSEICLCKNHNIQFVGGYNSLFYFDLEGNVCSINIINLMPNRRKFVPKIRNKVFNSVDFLVVPEIDRIYVISENGHIFVFIASSSQLTSHYNFSTSHGTNYFLTIF